MTIALFAAHGQGVCCLHLRCKLAQGHPLSPLTMQVALMPLGLVSTMTHLFPVVHIHWSYIFSRKPRQSSQYCQLCASKRLWGTQGGVYACDKLNIRQTPPPPILPQISVQKGRGGGGGGIFGSLWSWKIQQRYDGVPKSVETSSLLCHSYLVCIVFHMPSLHCFAHLFSFFCNDFSYNAM